MFVYSVKFVCGQLEESDQDEPVRPGWYATEINIHNPYEREVELRKLFVPVVRNREMIGREPEFTDPHAEDRMVLPPHTATMVDCFHIAELLGESSPMALTIGVLEISSSDRLEVTAVYTVTDRGSGVVSMDVEQIQGIQTE